MSETAKDLRERAAWEEIRAKLHMDLAEQCQRSAAALIEQAEDVEQRKGAKFQRPQQFQASD